MEEEKRPEEKRVTEEEKVIERKEITEKEEVVNNDEVTERKEIEEKPPKKTKKKKEQLLTISDTCKNCGTQLNLDQAFCSRCGAKRMYNRLNWRNLTEDFVDRFLNIENNFLRTFFALFIKPEDVIGGYIDGMRKRYLSAFSYFAISLTITGLYTFVFRKWFLTDDLFSQGIQVKNGIDEKGVIELVKKIMNWIFEYQSIATFISIPFFALVSKLVFWNYKKYNFIEHTVIYLYVYSHTQIIASIVGMLLVWSSIGQVMASSILPFVYIGYTAFVLSRLFNLTVKKIILKTLLFSVIVTILSVIVFGALGALLYFAGVFDPLIDMMKELEENRKPIRETTKAVKDSFGVDSIRQVTEKVKDTVSLLKK